MLNFKSNAMKVLLAVLFSLFLLNSCTDDNDNFRHEKSSSEISSMDDFGKATEESNVRASSAVNNLTAQFTGGASNGNNK